MMLMYSIQNISVALLLTAYVGSACAHQAPAQKLQASSESKPNVSENFTQTDNEEKIETAEDDEDLDAEDEEDEAESDEDADDLSESSARENAFSSHLALNFHSEKISQ